MIDREDLTRKAIATLGLKTNKPITPSTKSIFVHCPFHEDKTPSMSISIEKGLFKCFSCQRGGSIEKLYKELKGTNLYKDLGISTDPFDSYATINQQYNFNLTSEDLENSLKDISIEYEERDFKPIKENPIAIRYLRERGIPLEIANKLGMRYVNSTYINHSWFGKRLTVPIYEKGSLVSIEGRDVTGKSKIDKKYIKCKYPKDSSVNTLFNIDNLNFEEDVYAVEALMDVAVMMKYPELRNSTSIFGASITRRQIYLIKKFKKFILIPDNDKAGDESVAFLKRQGLKNVWVLRIPKEVNGVFIKDPGDYEMKSGNSLKDLIGKKWLHYAKPLN